MEVKKHSLCLVKMAVTTYLKLFHSECLRCLLTDKKKGSWIFGVESRPRWKQVLCPREGRLQEILHVVKTFLGHLLALAELVIQKRPILMNIKQRSQGTCPNPCILALSSLLYLLLGHPHKWFHIPMAQYLHCQCRQYLV